MLDKPFNRAEGSLFRFATAILRSDFRLVGNTSDHAPILIDLADVPKRRRLWPGEDALMTDDPYNLKRFVMAQEPIFDIALAELKAGNKRGHWMWFVFPQLRGLGHSPTAQFYGIASVDEARAYLRHDMLGSRLTFCTQTVLEGQAQSVHDIFGSPDDLKFRSSMTLFEAAAPKEDVFGRALDGLCSGKRDERTLYSLTT